ncbi:SDR family oxidoreductase [Halogeometricum sp. S1BR25-6]|uniref:SDR family oxidoreductase n=1 Tax=Halogeometricum salsisoli TaxID=2950536 RepID=A0ABU2GD83_9EURY|nr:SDR family oxidoreductase [Halogeometricum sp. S1BR25-6]MDS0298752.1 SDR family oxidoreductase [Halogeometricum sp. S1BR25-6]
MSSTDRSEVVVITGSSSGIGRATAHEFAEDGARVALLARNEERLENAKAEVEERGGKALAIPTDVSEYDEVEAAAERVEEEFGPIDTWVNAAMATVFGEFTEVEPEEFERATDVNYLGFVNGSHVALNRMVPRDSGTLVQVGSALSYRGIPLQAAYCGSKFAIRGMTDSIRTELLHDDSDVHVTTVHLPGVNTPQFDQVKLHVDKLPRPVAPVFQPEVAADSIHWAAHHERREVYVGRSTVKTIWGNKIAPWLVDRLLAKQGYSGQFRDEDVPDDYEDYLFEPKSGDRGTHGSFDDEAEAGSVQLTLTKHREALGAVLGVLALVAAKLYVGDDG